MRNILLASLFLFLHISAKAQFSYTLLGNPVNTTGWTLAAPTTYVATNTVVLNDAFNNQAGYVYYSTPVNLTGCSQFTVTFDFQITNSSAPPADGIAFWYITAPPSGFINGGGIGLPNNPTGLALILDTYDNDGNVNNPLVSLRYFNGVNYTEGSATGQIAPDVTGQNFITNGGWHTCVLDYNNGNMTVAFDGNPPIMSGYNLLNITGYFGFSASTGASWSKHTIRNVTIEGTTLAQPVVNTPVTYCQFDTAVALTAVGTDLKWYTSAVGGSPLPAAPVPSTSIPGTYTWYVSQTIPGCGESSRDTIDVVVVAKPSVPTINYKNSYCVGETFQPFNTGGSTLLWYTTLTAGAGTAVPPVISTAAADSVVWYVSETVNGCESDRATIIVKIIDTPVPDFSYVIHYGCTQDTVEFANLTTLANNYQWTFGDGSGDTATNPAAHIYTVQGIYDVKLKAFNNNGCVDSVTKSINLLHPLSAGFSIADDTICQGEIVSFTNTSSATNPLYFWDLGDGTLDSTVNPVHTYPDAGVYEVRMILLDLGLAACMDTAFKTITVDSLPTVSFVTSDSVLCEGRSIHFLAEHTNMGLQTLAWNFSGATGFSQNPIQYTFDSSGVFNVSFVGTYRACGSASFNKNVTITAFPRLNLGPDTTICPNGRSVLLRDNINAGNADARWTWNTGETTSFISVRHHGIYTLKVEVNGCATDDSVEVFKDCYIDIPNAFTPNGDEVNDYFLPRQLLSKGVTAFHMSIFNRWGQLIFETSKIDGRGWDGMFNEKPQPSGVYIYLVEAEMKNGAKESYKGNVTLLR